MFLRQSFSLWKSQRSLLSDAVESATKRGAARDCNCRVDENRAREVGQRAEWTARNSRGSLCSRANKPCKQIPPRGRQIGCTGSIIPRTRGILPSFSRALQPAPCSPLRFHPDTPRQVSSPMVKPGDASMLTGGSNDFSRLININAQVLEMGN